MNRSPLQFAGMVVAGVTTPIVVVAAAVIVFFNPVWISFEQGRANATGWTGYTKEQVDQVTGAILSDLVFGPPNFDVTVDGQPVFDERERSHMRDVRGVFAELGFVALAAVVLLTVAGVASRGGRWFWLAVRAGATVLVGVVAVAGVGVLLFFDPLFEIFHEIFFPPGTYMFNPATDKMVQLLPDQFWSETTLAVGLVIIFIALLVRGAAGHLAEVAAPDVDAVTTTTAAGSAA